MTRHRSRQIDPSTPSSIGFAPTGRASLVSRGEYRDAASGIDSTAGGTNAEPVIANRNVNLVQHRISGHGMTIGGRVDGLVRRENKRVDDSHPRSRRAVRFGNEVTAV